MNPDLFDRIVIIKKLKDIPGTQKKRWSSTATTDASIQDETSNVGSGVGAEFIETFYCALDISDLPFCQHGRKLVDKATGNEYEIRTPRVERNPITGTEYVECILVLTRSRQNNDKNYVQA